MWLKCPLVTPPPPPPVGPQLKQQKERLESKELHTALLRKKVQDMEEQERRSHSALALERDGALGAVRRLHKKVERLQSELNAAKLSSTELGAQAAHSTELKVEGRRVQTASMPRGRVR